jgi:type II secretory pathway pseudopilin PulG
MQDRKAEDELLLVDYVLGRLAEPESEALRRRLEADEDLRRLHGDVKSTFAAVGLMPEYEPSEALVEETLARVRRQRQTDALLAREKPSPRVVAPTFSLRELGAVAAVLIILAVIFVPSFTESRRLAVQGQCASNVGQIGYGLQAYATTYGGALPGVEADQPRWLPAEGRPAVSNSRGLYKLILGRYVSPVSFQCPAVARGSFVVQAGMVDFPQAKFISYSYQHTIGPGGLRRDDPKLQAVAPEMAVLADDTPLFRDGRFLAERLRSPVSDSHGGRGQNVLYLDMHVEFRPQPEAGVGGDNIYLAGDIHQYSGTERPTSPLDTFLLPSYSPAGAEAKP